MLDRQNRKKRPQGDRPSQYNRGPAIRARPTEVLAGDFSAAPGAEIDGTKTDRTDEADAAKRETDGARLPRDPP
jgi:hypothetical protein